MTRRRTRELSRDRSVNEGRGVQRPEDTARKNSRGERFLSKRQKGEGRKREGKKTQREGTENRTQWERVATYDPIFDRHNVLLLRTGFTCTYMCARTVCSHVRRSYSGEDVGKKKHHTVVKKRRTVLGSGGDGGGGGRAT